MGETVTVTASLAVISAMVAPGLLMLGSASLVASALVRMARVVDRARALAALAQDGAWEKAGITRVHLHAWLDRHARRARYAGRSVGLLYAAIVLFVATCLTIAGDRVLGGALGGAPRWAILGWTPLGWAPLGLAIAGTLLLLAGAAYMVAESTLSGRQIEEEIHLALTKLEGAQT